MSRLARAREWAVSARDFLRPLPRSGPSVPSAPALPPGRCVNVTGRGETFVREAAAPPEAPPGAPAIVLLHGWTLSADLNWFSGVYEVASRRGRMVAPDLRGHGRGLRSEEPFTLEAAADDVAGLLRDLDLGPAVVVGYSMGGSVALLLANAHPELVAGLVLASTALQWRSSQRERAMWAALEGIEYTLRLNVHEAVADRYLRHATLRSPQLVRFQSWLKAEARRGDPADIAAAGRALALHDARDLAPGINVPTVAVITCHDQLIVPEKQREMVRAIPGALAVEVDGAHNAWMAKAREWVAAVDQALDMVGRRLTSK
ncbi:MAG: alpha/beta fold hydrolase [Acidimicrobiales bacterium]